MTDELPPLSEPDPIPKMLGYLNFSGGAADGGFRSGLNAMCEAWGARFTITEVAHALMLGAEELEGSTPAFDDLTQARSAIKTVEDFVFPAYVKFHADLLGHLRVEAFQQPFLLAKMFEATLAAGAPFGKGVVDDVLSDLNDYIGFRPVAVLENGREMQPYPHESFCPVPLYFDDAGVACGPYADLISAALVQMERMQNLTPELFELAMFEPNRMAELALDYRSHDHLHPVNKRTNYMFGEWDPHTIDNKGFFRRFVLRQVILDALLQWSTENKQNLGEEALHDAAAVLVGTVLMASAISGSGPEAHQSHVSLSTLLPQVAGLRDDYYAAVVGYAEGERGQRLRKIQEVTQQPFGHVRQGLNIFLAGYGSMQIQLRELALLFARMGYPEAARQKALSIPCLATRFETEIQLRLTLADRHQSAGELESAVRMLADVEDLIARGIDCGALIDPWNILAFAGQFPLFQSRDDVIYDQRAEVLLNLVDDFFRIGTLTLGEAVSSGEEELAGQLSRRFETFADRWDRYATSTVNDLPKVEGEESWIAAGEVARILTRWRKAGESAGDVGFWREHVSKLSSPLSLHFVAEKLLEKEDLVSSMALLMRWLDLADEAHLPEVHPLLLRWLGVAVRTTRNEPEATRVNIRRLFAHMEANAAEFWSVPLLTPEAASSSDPYDDEAPFEMPYEDDDEDEEENIFGAAYDQVVFRDSADDGVYGEMDEGPAAASDSELDVSARSIEPRLHFLHTVAQLWQMAGMTLAMQASRQNDPLGDDYELHVTSWLREVVRFREELMLLMHQLDGHRIAGDFNEDSGMEYDMQLQRKLSLLHQAINTHVSFQAAERTLLCCLDPDPDSAERRHAERDAVVTQIRFLLTEQYAAAKEQLPRLLRTLRREPLLYLPLENGGEPKLIAEARNRQAIMQFLIGSLARCGLLKQSWHVLRTAQRMEQVRRPRGVAVTEFDRLFTTGLRSILESLIRSVREWGDVSSEELVEQLHRVLEPFHKMWTEHARTMRLSAVESVSFGVGWDDMQEFIETYGNDLLHAADLTLGHLRSVLHTGVDTYLDYLDETEDPLKPIKLLEDLRNGDYDREHAVERLQTVYLVIVDQFDRFLEYNSTTTHSDYGNRLFCLLELLNVEAGYDRDAWLLTPDSITHEMLCTEGFQDAARLWEEEIQERTQESAQEHIDRLTALERKYGVLLPSLRDHLGERFVKSLAVNRMTALVPEAMRDAADLERATQGDAFQRLLGEVDAYLSSGSGAGIDVPTWLRNLEQEVREEEQDRLSLKLTNDLDLPLRTVSREELDRQIDKWQVLDED